MRHAEESYQEFREAVGTHSRPMRLVSFFRYSSSSSSSIASIIGELQQNKKSFVSKMRLTIWMWNELVLFLFASLSFLMVAN